MAQKFTNTFLPLKEFRFTVLPLASVIEKLGRVAFSFTDGAREELASVTGFFFGIRTSQEANNKQCGDGEAGS